MKIEGPGAGGLQAMFLNDESSLLEQSHRLRYQVYCVERGFLPAHEYPDQLERDDFDTHSVHVGVVDSYGELAATARLVLPNRGVLPLFQHCALFPTEGTVNDESNMVVEVSRVSVSRGYDRRRLWANGPDNRWLRTAEPFLTLLKAVVCSARHVGATHLIGATDAALHRRLVRLGFPYRVAGPTVDYYGPVAPHLMSLAELDDVILGGQYPALHDFPIGGVSAPWSRTDAYHGPRMSSDATFEIEMSQQVKRPGAKQASTKQTQSPDISFLRDPARGRAPVGMPNAAG
jgi:N-acyl amino acid synthase of PEP-CTERM/exosortase system